MRVREKSAPDAFFLLTRETNVVNLPSDAEDSAGGIEMFNVEQKQGRRWVSLGESGAQWPANAVEEMLPKHNLLALGGGCKRPPAGATVRVRDDKGAEYFFDAWITGA